MFVRQENISLPAQNIEATEEIRKQPLAVNWVEELGKVWNDNVHRPKVTRLENSLIKITKILVKSKSYSQ